MTHLTHSVLSALGISLMINHSCWANETLDTKAIATAYSVVELINLVRSQCQSMGHALDNTQYESWRQRNQIDALLPYLQQQINHNKLLADNKAEMDELVEQQVQALVPEGCGVGEKLLAVPDVNPLQQYPQLKNILLAEQKPAEPEYVFDPSAYDRIVDDIEAVVFHTLPWRGDHVAVPVILFEDGWSCSDMGVLVEYPSVEAHRKKYPKFWRKWRSRFGTFQLQFGDAWRDVTYQDKNDPFARDYRLQDYYQYLGGSSSQGGGNYAYFSNGYTFTKEGAFSRSQSHMVNSSNSFSGAQTFIGGSSDDQAGRYHIDGYLLTLTYNDGKVLHYAVVTDDQDDLSVLWINGTAYIRK